MGDPGITSVRIACSLAVIASLHLTPAAVAANCPERPPCEGCGCKGGPGYRGPDGRCVGFKLLDKVYGPAPHARCVFENAMGTGANRDCALAEPAVKPRAAPPTSE